MFMDVVPRELKVFKSQRRRKAYQLDQRKNIIEVVSSGSCRTEGRIYGLIKTLELMAPPGAWKTGWTRPWPCAQ